MSLRLVIYREYSIHLHLNKHDYYFFVVLICVYNLKKKNLFDQIGDSWSWFTFFYLENFMKNNGDDWCFFF